MLFYTKFILMKKTILSIIIPMYNTAPYIRQCLDSIIAQNGFPDFQVIVVDDGSKDNGPDIVQEYSIKYPNIELLCQENRGVSVARNRGLRQARGEYISFVDADDMVGVTLKKCEPYLHNQEENYEHANMVYKSGTIDDNFPEAPLGDTEYFTRMIDSARNNNAEIAMGGKIGVKKSTQEITALVYKKNRVFDTKLANKDFAILQSYDRESANFAVYRRNFLNKHKLSFEVDMPLDEDILFCTLAILHAKKVSTVCDSVYYYNRHSGTLTDYTSYMPIYKSRRRYSAALIQYFGTLLLELEKYPEYATIYRHYMHEFATLSCNCIRAHLRYFPTVFCHFCSKTVCTKCENNKKNIAAIKKGLIKLMPNKNQKIR